MDVGNALWSDKIRKFINEKEEQTIMHTYFHLTILYLLNCINCVFMFTREFVCATFALTCILIVQLCI